MRRRCRNVAGYVDRGIVVCEQWSNNFDAFLADMGPRPSPAHSLDRINNDGNYEPSNCRWATQSQQNFNKRNARVLEFRGERLHITEWAKRVGISYRIINMRLKEGWSIEHALTLPLQRGKLPPGVKKKLGPQCLPRSVVGP